MNWPAAVVLPASAARGTSSSLPPRWDASLHYALSVSPRRVSLARKLHFVPLPNLPSSSPSSSCLFLFLHRKKKFLDTDPDGIYKFGMNLAPGSVQSWIEGLVQRSELSRYLSSTVKNSILEKNIYTFSIAFLGLTLSKKNHLLCLFFWKKRTLSLRSPKSCSSVTSD